MAKKPRGGHRTVGPVHKLTEHEWRTALRDSLLAVRDSAIGLRHELEANLSEPAPFPTRRTFDIPSLPRLAASLRTLVGNGKGNRLLFRACDRFQIPPPTIAGHVSVSDPGGREALSYAEAESEGPARRSLETCMLLTCLIVRDTQLESSWSWGQLVSDVANKSGARVDADRPISWDKVGQYEVMGIPVIPRLLYRFGQVVAECGNSMLAHIGEPTMDLADLTPSLGGGTVSHVSVSEGKTTMG
jgi:hypothetical protein